MDKGSSSKVILKVTKCKTVDKGKVILKVTKGKKVILKVTEGKTVNKSSSKLEKSKPQGYKR